MKRKAGRKRKIIPSSFNEQALLFVVSCEEAENPQTTKK